MKRWQRDALYLLSAAALISLASAGYATEDSVLTLLGVLAGLLSPSLAFTYATEDARPLWRLHKARPEGEESTSGDAFGRPGGTYKEQGGE